MYKSGIYYGIDSFTKDRNRIICIGWAFSENGLVEIFNSSILKIEKKSRPDVVNFYHNKKVPLMCGFVIYLKSDAADYDFILKNSNHQVTVNAKKLGNKKNFLIYIKGKLNYTCLKKALCILLQQGPIGIVKKVRHGYTQMQGISYNQWYLSHKPTLDQLTKQKSTKFNYEPLISIITPTYNTPINFLTDMIQSVQNQTYSNWELCIADGSSNTSVYEHLKFFSQKDSRIRVIRLDKNEGISGNSNAALTIAKGDFIALLDHDDLLTPNALYEVVRKINDNPTCDMLYSDEDKTDKDGKQFSNPYFKPDFSIDLLNSYNYICHFLVLKKTLLDKAGKFFDSKFDGAQDYDLILRCSEQADNVAHISQILYHWRIHNNSTAASAESKPYTHIAGKKALIEHFKRLGIEADVLDGTKGINNTYKIKYKLNDEPMISIVIPSCEHIDDLKKCLVSIEKTIQYENYEIIIVENNSKNKDTFDYYNYLSQNTHIHILKYSNKFNYSAINNWAIQQAKGEYVVLMNNDIEMISCNWVREMMSYCQRDDVGIVGAKLYYPDDTIQHAGVIIGMGGVADHAFKGAPRDFTGYFSRAVLVQNLSAVTAALLMVKRSVFNSVDGFDENLAVAFNDVDLCLKIREKGYLIIFDPDVEAYHYESKSRGYEDTPEKKRRFKHEHEIFYSKWGKHYIDPYYNVNLTLQKNDFSLKI